MSDAVAPKPRRQFRAAVPRPSPEQARRQGDVAHAAWQALGAREAVMTFLNDHHEGLGGRPLDVALASDAGLARVRAALADQSREVLA